MNKTTGSGIDSDQHGKLDLQQATAWIQKAAEQGHAKAQFTLGKMYEEGEGESQDYQQAIVWYTKAAEQGDADAQFHLGRLYQKTLQMSDKKSVPDVVPVPDNIPAPEKQQSTVQPRTATDWLPSFLCKRRNAVMGLAGLAIVTVFMLAIPDQKPDPRLLRIKVPIPITGTVTNEDNTDFDEIPDHELVEAATPKDDIPADATPQWQYYRVRNGENLTTIFNNLGLSSTTLYEVFEADTKNFLQRLKPGQTLQLLIDRDNILQQMKTRLSIKQTFVLERTGDSYRASMLNLNEDVQWQQKRYDYIVKGSFYSSSSNAGLSTSQIIKIGNLLQWRLNFATNLNEGDRFKVLVQQETVQGKSTGNTQLLGVEFISQGKTMSAWLSEDGNYYDGQGNSLERGFRRYPTHSRYRVIADFDPAKRDPVTGQVSPNEGTDFAMPVGTAVMASGDGVVLEATRHPLAGVYVVIKHGRTLSTRYLHLSKLLVKPGQRVKMGDKIALSGKSGNVKDPTLHYEIRINNRPVNPMKVKLPMAESLSGKEKRQFLAKVDQYRREMNGDSSAISVTMDMKQASIAAAEPAPAPTRPKPVPQVAAAHSISDAICSNYENIMLNSILGFRARGVPVQAAMDVFRSERDVDTRVFLKAAVQIFYSDPVKGRQTLTDGRFRSACVKIHRGY